MKITQIYVKSFGKLKDFTYQFNQGLNVTIQDNGFGKSTLVGFIKAMFYGFEYKKQSNGETDARTYMPWGSTEKFGGYIDFTHNGGNYRIERYFTATAKGHEGRLIDLSTGAMHSVDNLGKQLFGVDATAFSQSLYIAQDAVEITANDDFISKLTDMVDGNKKENNFQRAEDRLRSLSKQYRHEKGNGGQIYQTQQQLDLAYSQLLESNKNQTDLADKKQRLADVNQDVQRLQKQKYQIEQSIEQFKQLESAYSQLLDSHKNYNELVGKRQRLAEVKQDIAYLQQQKSQVEQSIEQLQQVVQINNVSAEQQNTNQAFADARDYITTHNRAVIEDEPTAQQLAKDIQLQQTNKPKVSPLIWLAAVLAIAGIVLTLTVVRLWAVGVAVMVVGFVLMSVFLDKYRKRKNDVKSKQTDLSKQLLKIFVKYNLTGSREQNLDALKNLRQEYLNKQAIYDALRNSAQAQTVDYTAEKNKLSALLDTRNQLESKLSQYGKELGSLESKIEYLTQQPSVAEASENYNSLKQQFAALLTKYDIMQMVDSAEKLQLSTLQDIRYKVESKLDQCRVELGSLENQIRYLSQQPSVAETGERYANLKQQLAILQGKYDTVQTALNLLRKAKEQVSSSYLPPLADKVGALLQRAIDIDGVIVNENFDVSLQHNGFTRPVELHSKGIQELTAFCFRIALSQSVYGELPLLVVDDAFVNLDETNFAKAMQILKDLSQTTQVIYFSCHERSKTN